MNNANINPHDKVFKDLLQEKHFAQAFLKQYLSKEDLLLFDIDSIMLWNAQFISAGSEYKSDVVYKASTISDNTGYIIFLFEHQSTPEKLMPFRILEYNMLLMRQHLKQGHSKLPIIIPIVFYHGSITPYPYDTHIANCFENPDLGLQYLLKPFTLIDVTIIPDEKLKQDIITAPLQILMKYIRESDLLPYIKELADEGILEKNAAIDEKRLLLRVIPKFLQNASLFRV